MHNVSKKTTNVKEMLPILIGTFLEYYDYMLYMHFLFILTPLFFPNENYVLMQIMGMTSFAISFCTRPFGALIFGYIGDKYGRKKSLALSITLMSFPTMVIALLPTYENIGLYAPIALMLCRLIQGFSAGGEASGANVSLFECAKKDYKYTITSLFNVACWGGGLLGSILGLLFLSFEYTDAWRIPFVLGGIIGFFGYYIRQHMGETRDFSASIKSKENIKFLHFWKNILSVIALSAGATIPVYMIFVYLNQIHRNVLQATEEKIIINNIIISIFIMVMQPIFGYLSDRLDSQKVMQLCALSFIMISYPLFKYTLTSPSYENLLFTQLLLAFFYSGIAGPACAYLVRLFPVLQRCKGVGLSWSLGIALYSFVPTLALALAEITGRRDFVSIFMILSGILSWMGVHYGSKLLTRQTIRTLKILNFSSLREAQ